MITVFPYLTGQGCYHPPPARQLITYVSHDFERWTESFCVGLRRGDPLYSAYGLNGGEQVHLGAAMWNRGNVIIGFYGKWNGHPSNDRRLVSLDLGLAVTNDGIHYREPIPDFPMVSAAEDGWGAPPLGDPRVKPPALTQGQGADHHVHAAVGLDDSHAVLAGPSHDKPVLYAGSRTVGWNQNQPRSIQGQGASDHGIASVGADEDAAAAQWRVEGA